MGIHWMSSRLKFINRNILFYSLSILLLFFFFFLIGLFNTSPSKPSSLVFRCQMSAKADFLSQFEKTSEKSTKDDESKLDVVVPMSLAIRVGRILIGLGSSPPRCSWKCGRCTPCRPVHVPVPPGVPVTTEYYPEAWRCKCGNKLYMP